MSYGGEALLWSGLAITIVLVVIGVPEIIIRRRRARAQHRAERLRRRIKRRAVRDQAGT